MAEVIHRYVGRGDKLPKPTPEEKKRAAAEHAADAALSKERTESIRTKRMQAQLVLARARGELVPREMVLRQTEFLIVALRQRLLAIPQTYSRRLLGISEFEVMSKLLKEMAISTLKEIENLPRVVEEGWVDRGETEEPEK